MQEGSPSLTTKHEHNQYHAALRVLTRVSSAPEGIGTVFSELSVFSDAMLPSQSAQAEQAAASASGDTHLAQNTPQPARSQPRCNCLHTHGCPSR